MPTTLALLARIATYTERHQLNLMSTKDYEHAVKTLLKINTPPEHNSLDKPLPRTYNTDRK